MTDDAARYADLTIAEFTNRLASAAPVPGGGSASAVAAALAASLVEMVARLSADRPKYEPYVETHERAAAIASAARRDFLALADADAAAYSRLADAFKLPRDDDALAQRRTEQIGDAARDASDVPLRVVRACRELAVDIEALAGRSNLNASSDLNVAALLVHAAGQGAGANVLVNLPMVDDPDYVGEATVELQGYLEEIDRLGRQTREQVGHGGLRDPEEG
jgi:formiminotetrahydrofolate cyclodeaminase